MESSVAKLCFHENLYTRTFLPFRYHGKKYGWVGELLDFRSYFWTTSPSTTLNPINNGVIEGFFVLTHA